MRTLRTTNAPNELYKVVTGDNLWNIAKANNLSLQDLYNLNPDLQNKDIIHTGDIIRIRKQITPPRYKYRTLREIEAEQNLANRNNISSIQSSYHDSNYVIIDKKNKRFTVYDKNNNKIYETKDIATGASKNDYNTVTYVDENGIIRDMMGNNSTPAGISIISGIGEYHGVPSFTRSRVDNYGNLRTINNKNDDIASSLHYGSSKGLSSGSNGCVRLSSKTLKQLPKYIGVGTKVYTLPEQAGSRFEVREGKLNYFADNPYGSNEGDKQYWDDYNVVNNRSYNPLYIKNRNKSDDAQYNKNVYHYANTIERSKEHLQKLFNIDSYTYDKLAQLAMGIAQQETKFNTSRRKKLKDIVPDWILNKIRGNSNRSRGATQIKLKGDNKEMQALYNKYNITEDNIDNMDKAAVATMLRLAYMYNNEVRGRNFINNKNEQINPYDTLLYKWMGRNSELKNKTATPKLNNYINNVHNYINDFDFLVGQQIG